MSRILYIVSLSRFKIALRPHALLVVYINKRTPRRLDIMFKIDRVET